MLAIGTAVLASVFASIRPEGVDLGSAANVDATVDAYNSIFTIAFGMLVVALVVAQFLPARRRALELQEQRRAEQEGRLAEIGELDLETEGALAGEVL
jgi:hypothetical protein